MPEGALDAILLRDSVCHYIHSGTVKNATMIDDFPDSASTFWDTDCIEASTCKPVSSCFCSNIYLWCGDVLQFLARCIIGFFIK